MFSKLHRMQALGIDIGGSGIKGAVVDTRTGEFVTPRFRIATPQPPVAEAVIRTVKKVISKSGYRGSLLGIGFPGVIRQNLIETAVNLHQSLVGINLADHMGTSGFKRVAVINDADAAGIAEVQLGSARDLRKGTVLMLTVGTGIGSALFIDGKLVPNMEIGHIEYAGQEAESYISERARLQQEWTWEEWGTRFNGYLEYLEHLLQPDLIILGGGGVKYPARFRRYIHPRTPWKLAHFGNKAGIIGAALAACCES